MRQTTRLTAMAAALAATALLATGCSSSGSSSSGSSSRSPSPSASMTMSMSPGESMSSSDSSAQGAKITIKDFKFSGPSSVKAGSTITVKNEDSAAHTVTADKGGAFDVQVPGGATKTFTAPKAGTYAYHCTYHSNMHGTLKVS